MGSAASAGLTAAVRDAPAADLSAALSGIPVETRKRMASVLLAAQPGALKTEAPASSSTPAGEGKNQDAEQKKNQPVNLWSQGQFMDVYKLQGKLGEGAFGVVCRCMHRESGKEFAVKMIDKVEAPMAEIAKEVEMLQRLSHPSVVTLHEAFDEKVFVCLVMDLIQGGDLLKGMMSHWQAKGMIAVDVIQNVSKQMHNAVAWVHSNNVVHRDVKGDNFLMDGPNLEELSLRVYLADFGTVVPCESNERLKAKAGTSMYWSPEFYARNYGLKVDTWAVGVVMFGLVTAKFPFRHRKDVEGKVVKLPETFPKDGRDVIYGLLDRDEDARWTSAQALAGSFLSTFNAADHKEVSEFEAGHKPDMKENGANVAIVARRKELIGRLQDASTHPDSESVLPKVTAKGSSVCVNFDAVDSFDVNDGEAYSGTFEWWAPSKVKECGLLDSDAKPLPDGDQQSDLGIKEQTLKEMFEKNEIKVADFGKGQAKSLRDLAQEVTSGAARMMLDATSFRKVVRVVDVVSLRISRESGGSKQFLINISEQFPDGRTQCRSVLPGTKKKSFENGVQTVQRIVRDVLKMDDCQLVFDYNAKECFEFEEESLSYPGLRTVYRKAIFEGKMTSADSAILQRVRCTGNIAEPFDVEDSQKYSRSFKWFSQAQCVTDGIKFKAPKEGAEVSALVYAPLGIDEEELSSFLTANGVDVSQFGQGTNRSLQEFSSELIAGEAVLQHQDGGKITRIVDVVLLNITRDDGNVLVEVSETVNGTTQELKRLPGVKRRSDENHFLAAQRILTKLLRVNESSVNLSADGVLFSEQQKESTTFCGLPSLYHKRLVFGSVSKTF